MICRVCGKDIVDAEGAHTFHAKGKQFHTHTACRDLVYGSGVLLGQVAKQFVELRNPGLFQSPGMRGFLAAIKELRK